MKLSSLPPLLQKQIVLVGAGNAHLLFVKRWGMRPVPGITVTLVNEAPVVPYSAMVPAHIAGEYPREAISIDLVRLCQWAKVRLVAEPVQELDCQNRRILFANRPELTFDVLSLGLGSLSQIASSEGPSSADWILRPLGPLIDSIQNLQSQMQNRSRPFHLVVVGGGPSGCELTLAIHQRLSQQRADFRITLVHQGERLFPQFPEKVSRLFSEALQNRGIEYRLKTTVLDHRNHSLFLEGGEELVCDQVLWATNAAPPHLLKSSGLACNEAGFLLVHKTLQSVSHPAVFGTGDCVSFPDYPKLLKNGVHAVRQGGVLFENVLAYLQSLPLQPFVPQRRCLCLLNRSDGSAVLSYGSFTLHGKWVRRWKDRIDRAWIEKFSQLEIPTQMGPDSEPLMYCGGCGSKVPGDVLAAVLKKLVIPADPRVLLGCQSGEDAAVFRVPSANGNLVDQVEVQTVDYFKTFTDDPYFFGQIAALNAVSDLYAMNAQPFSALAIATLPYARGPIQEAVLYELLRGASEALQEMGVILAGGHTTEGTELALGFSVTGYADPDRLFQKGQLKPGDVFILTKPLGTGAILAAANLGACSADWYLQLQSSMRISNRSAAAIFNTAGVRACTDVTGFGLAGHLLEMLDASQVSARLTMVKLPIYAGFREVVEQEIVSSLHAENAKVLCRIQGQASSLEFASLFDPQTSGGLLAAVPPEKAAALLAQLHQADCPQAAIIGTVEELQPQTKPTLFVS